MELLSGEPVVVQLVELWILIRDHLKNVVLHIPCCEYPSIFVVNMLYHVLYSWQKCLIISSFKPVTNKSAGIVKREQTL